MVDTKWVDWSKTTRSKDYRGSSSFATFLIIGLPALIARMLHIIVSVGFLGFFVKLFRPSEANVLFDGGSLMLYVIGVGVYISNIVKGCGM
ncbi:Protein csh3 [Collariella sp. IMI 366227]|nr:Protein csh3 [Collariella sp. IMI 366227]